VKNLNLTFREPQVGGDLHEQDRKQLVAAILPGLLLVGGCTEGRPSGVEVRDVGRPSVDDRLNLWNSTSIRLMAPTCSWEIAILLVAINVRNTYNSRSLRCAR